MGAARSLRALIPLVLSGLAFCVGAQAQDFYQGRQVRIIVGFTAGGTYDLTARLYARHIGNHLPGKPTVIVQNMAGSGSLVATTHLYNVAPKDGTVLAVVGGGTALEPLLGNAQAKYEPTRFAWIGGRSRDNFLCLALGTSGVKSIDDVKRRELVVGATGPGSRTLTFPRALNELAGTRFKIVSGYPGGNEITMAMERGEVEGYCGWALDSIRSRAPDWLPSGKVVALAQFTLAPSAALPDVPLADALAPTEIGRQAIRMLASDSILAWPFIAPPDLPAERVAELRAAFDAVSKDPEFLAEARKAKLEIDPVSGRELQAMVAQLYATPKDVVELVRKISAK